MTIPRKALIFDYDDTLVQTRQVRYSTLKKLAHSRYAQELGDAAIDAAWGKPGLEFMEILFGKWEKDFDAMWIEYNKLCEGDPNRPYDGAVDFLEEVAGKLPLGILSSSSRRRVLPELKDAAIDESLFLKIQTAEDTPVHKPDPAVFAPWIRLLATMGIGPGEILYVGDSLQDHAAAAGAGINFLGMAHAETDVSRFTKAKLPFVRSFAELTSYPIGAAGS